MKKLSLLLSLFFSACITINIVESPLANKQISTLPYQANQTSPLSAIRLVAKTGSFKDERDGQTYKTVTLGKQTWMAQNLNFKTKEGSLYYNNDPKNGEVYGMLYNFYALPEACPKGWHVPTNAEWEELEYNAGMQKDGVIKDMFRGSVAANFLDSGATKMNVLFAGEYGRSHFYDIGESACFWTSTRESSPIVSRLFKKGDSRICKNRNGEAYSLSVRCVKDSF